MEKPNDIKRDSISVNYFLNTAAYSGLFSLLSVILTGQVSAASSLYVGLALGILSLFSRGSTVFIGSLIERFSTVSLTETGFGFMVFSLLLLQPAMGGFIGFLFADLALLGLGLSLVNFALRGHIIATERYRQLGDHGRSQKLPSSSWKRPHPHQKQQSPNQQAYRSHCLR